SLLSAALHQDPSLIEAGADKRVILATPTTLIGLLRAVNYGWSQQKLAKNAQLISQLGGDLYDALAVMTGHVRKMGGSLKSAVDHYNSLVGSAERRVAPKARRLLECGVPVRKEVGDLDVIDATTRQVTLRELEESTDEVLPELVGVDDADSRFQDFAEAEDLPQVPREGLAKQVDEARTPIRLSSIPPSGW
ncbi:MAG: DNA recombination protein RmuC, partial [Deltaproteobacteria bacterium]|nr:DNA recombination protein RmuC [Deltaproteobacteria bacterium]